MYKTENEFFVDTFAEKSPKLYIENQFSGLYNV